LIWKRYQKVCKIAAGIDDRTEDEAVHRLRIQCKKLRYLMEFFAPVFPRKEFQSILKPLKRLQDNLGLFNDYSVQQESLRALLDDLDQQPEKRDLEIAQSVGALIVVLHKKQLEERARVVESFAKFNNKGTRHTFRKLFHNQKRAA
jgi:CHAD domain-containing protein